MLCSKYLIAVDNTFQKKNIQAGIFPSLDINKNIYFSKNKVNNFCGIKNNYYFCSMTYENEGYVLDTLMELQETIRSKEFKQHIKETHENNQMLKYIVKVVNTYIAKHHQENEDDFIRNIIANQVSNMLDINSFIKK